MKFIQKSLVFFFVLFFSLNVLAACNVFNPFSWLECLAPVSSAIVAPLAAFTGNFDSDLLLISGTPTFMEGQNQPLTGDVVLSKYVVGIGNDVAAVGTYDNEKSNVSALRQTADYFVTAKKVKNNTIIPFVGSQKVLKSVKTTTVFSGTENSFSLGSILSETEVQNAIRTSAAPRAYEDCKRHLGNDFAAFAWRPVTTSDAPYPPRLYYSVCSSGNWLGNTCLFGNWYAQVYFECYQFSGSQVAFQEFGAKTVDTQVDVSLINNKNQQSSVLSLAVGNCGSNCRTEGYFMEGGKTIGFAKIIGLQSSFELPLDLTNEAPAKIDDYSWALISSSEAKDAWNQLKSLTAVPTYTDWTGDLIVMQKAITDYQRQFVEVYLSKKDKFKDKWSFMYNPSLNAFIVNDTYTENPLLQVIVLGNWLGLIRDYPSFTVSCGNSVSGYAQETKYSSATVTNVSNSNGAVTVAWGCPTGNNTVMDTIGANQSKTYDVPMYSSIANRGNCTVQVSWGNEKRTCDIGFDFKEKPSSCGNTVVDSGETCVNCPQDITCDESNNYYCNRNSLSNTYGQCVLKDTIPPVIVIPPQINWTLIVAVVLVIVGVGLVAYGYYKGGV